MDNIFSKAFSKFGMVQFIVFCLLILGIYRSVSGLYARIDVHTQSSRALAVADHTFKLDNPPESFIEKKIRFISYLELHKGPRIWGPIAYGVKWLTLGGKKWATIEAENLWRAILLCSFISSMILLTLLVRDCREVSGFSFGWLWIPLICALGFQCGPAIYNISNGGADAITGLAIIGHFYFFIKRRFWLASIFIVVGTYYKLHPVTFAFGFFVLACLSRSHRKYVPRLIIVGLSVAALVYPIRGLFYGSLYPFTLVWNNVASAVPVLPLTEECFNPVVLIYKIAHEFKITGFEAMNRTEGILPYVPFLSASLFALAFTGISAYISRYSKIWEKNQKTYLRHMIIFQMVLGFAYFIFSMDISIEFMLHLLLTIYGPILLFAMDVGELDDINFTTGFNILLYALSLFILGCLLPLSFLHSFLPYEYLHQLAGNPPGSLGSYGAYIWYQIPMFSFLLMGIVAFRIMSSDSKVPCYQDIAGKMNY